MQIPSGLVMMLKSFGISIPDETLQQINEMIPQLPKIVPAALQAIDGFDKRLQNLETAMAFLVIRAKEQDARRNNSDNPDTRTGPGTGPGGIQ